MNTNYINEFLEKNLTPEKLMHTEGVIMIAMKLAKIYGADTEKARLAGKYHDMAKCFDEGELDLYVKHYSLPEIYIGKPNISHAKVAMEMMKDIFSVSDKEILDAVSYHTTGRADMTLLDEIIYVSDAIEVNRDYEGVEILRNLALKDIDGVCLKIINSTIDRVNSKGMYLDEDTAAAKKYLEDKIKEDINGK